MAVGKSWSGLIVEGTAGTKAQRRDAIKGVCGAGATRSKAADVMEDLGRSPECRIGCFPGEEGRRKKEKEGEER